MVDVLRAKWKDSENKLLCFCDDDTGKTEYQAKYDDTNNVLELHGDADYQVKWNDATNKFEAQQVAGTECSPTMCDRQGVDDEFDVYFEGITDCGGCDEDCESFNGNTYRCTWDGTFYTYHVGNRRIVLNCTRDPDYYMQLVAYVDYSGPIKACLYIGATTPATELPQTADNVWLIGVCCTDPVPPSAITINGYGGSAQVSLVA